MMNPSCQWDCGPCGTIVTNAANDGLPVELMDFKIVQGRADDDEPEAEAGADE